VALTRTVCRCYFCSRCSRHLILGRVQVVRGGPHRVSSLTLGEGSSAGVVGGGVNHKQVSTKAIGSDTLTLVLGSGSWIRDRSGLHCVVESLVVVLGGAFQSLSEPSRWYCVPRVTRLLGTVCVCRCWRSEGKAANGGRSVPQCTWMR